ncbi:KTSC domain-containing protein [Lysobacter sp. F6437]|uniref:KTSC domain-containing protein n=1 Tax=Lysobacter sp. F6437 TaxID=3459296 RepID=UPI00403D83DC
MRRRRVESEALRSVGYDGKRQVLEIEFQSGELYRYFDVPASVHAGLMEAQSHGEYFSQHVRDRFDYEHLD